MTRTRAEIQAWHDHLVSLKATPDGTVEVHGGKDWARIHPMKCPICRRVFYGWKPVDAEWAPYAVEDDPPLGRWSRETCGHPLCWKAEDERQWRRRMAAGAPSAAPM